MGNFQHHHRRRREKFLFACGDLLSENKFYDCLSSCAACSKSSLKLLSCSRRKLRQRLSERQSLSTQCALNLDYNLSY